MKKYCKDSATRKSREQLRYPSKMAEKKISKTFCQGKHWAILAEGIRLWPHLGHLFLFYRQTPSIIFFRFFWYNNEQEFITAYDVITASFKDRTPDRHLQQYQTCVQNKKGSIRGSRKTPSKCNSPPQWIYTFLCGQRCMLNTNFWKFLSAKKKSLNVNATHVYLQLLKKSINSIL